MARRWTIKTSAKVRMDTPSLVEWLRRPERNEEALAYLEERDVVDWSIEETLVDSMRTRDIRFVTRTGSKVHARLEQELDPEGHPGRWEGGSFIIPIHEIRHVVKAGHEETLDFQRTLAFRPDGDTETLVTSTVRRMTASGRWYEWRLPPVSERVGLERGLRFWVLRWESALRSQRSE